MKRKSYGIYPVFLYISVTTILHRNHWVSLQIEETVIMDNEEAESLRKRVDIKRNSNKKKEEKGKKGKREGEISRGSSKLDGKGGRKQEDNR